MKKIIICSTIILIPLIISFIFLTWLLLNEIKDNSILEQRIQIYEEKINNNENINDELNDEIKILTEQYKDKIEEYEVWEELKNNLTNILSS